MIRCKECKYFNQSCAGFISTNFISGSGPKDSRVMVIYDSPFHSDVTAESIGSNQEYNNYLNNYLQQINLNTEKVYVTSFIKCFISDKKKKPTKTMKDKCVELYLDKEIQEVKPKVLLLMGRMATQYFIPEVTAKVPLKQVVGKSFFSSKHNCYMIPMFDMYYLANFNKNSPQVKQIGNALAKTKVLLEGGEVRANRPKINYSHDLKDVALLGEYTTIDVETTGLNSRKDKILTIAMSDGKINISFDFMSYKDEMSEVITQEDGQVVIKGFQEFYCVVLPFIIEELKKRKLIGHNMLFDLKMLLASGYDLTDNLVADTRLMQFLVNPQGANALGFLIQLYYGVAYKESIDRENMVKMEVEDRRYYCAEDAYYTHRLFLDLFKALKQQDSLISNKIITDIIRNIVFLETKGILVDKDKILELIEFYGKEKEEHKAKFKKRFKLSDAFNLNSSVQMCKFLYEDLGLPILVRTKTKDPKTGEYNPSADAEAITRLAEKRPALSTLVDYRTSKGHIEKLKGYLEAIEDDGRVHSSFNPFSPDSSRLMSAKPNCFSGDTEILTNLGWVKFNKLQKKHDLSIANYRTSDANIEFTNTFDIISERNQNLIHLHNKHIDLLMTDNHNCLLKNRKTNKYRKFLAKDYPEDYLQLNAAKFTGFSGLDISNAELEFLIALQAYGSIRQDCKRLDFSFIKDRKKKQFELLLTQLNLSDTRKTTGKRTRYLVHISDRLNELLQKYISKDKTFTVDFIFNLNRLQIDYLLSVINSWDGCFTRQNCYSSNNKKNSDLIQILYTLSNRRVKQRIYKTATGKNNYQLDVSTHNYSLTTNIKKEYFKGDFLVYCVSVPHKNIIIRRNGKVCITGNCQNVPRKSRIKEIFIAAPGYSYIYFDQCQVEFRVWIDLSKDPKGIEFINSGRDIHAFIASQFYRLPEAYFLDKTNEDGRDKRTGVKAIVYGSMYGRTPEGIVREHGGSLEDATAIQTIFFRLCQTGWFWLQQIEQEIIREKKLRTPFGTYRFFNDIELARPNEKEEIIRMGKSFKVQSWAAEIAFLGLAKTCRKLREEGLDATWIHNIHDANIFEVLDAHLDRTKQIIEEYMTSPYKKMSIPLPIEMKVGKSWAEVA